MACASSTAPINISSKDYTNECSLKCMFKYNYPRVPSVTVANQGNYLEISYEKAKVSYNNTDLVVNGIRLYTPSLHTFDGKRADAELVINHMDMGISLLLCIPVTLSASSTNASESLGYILTQAASRTPNAGEKAVIPTKNFTLNDFVPKKSPLYSYKATLPYPPCNGDHQYVVFMPEDSPVFISPVTMASLKKIMTPHDSSIKPKLDYFFNKRGAVFLDPTSDDNDDDIYIDCQPTGSNGEPIQVPSGNREHKKAPLDFSNPIVITILGIVGGILLIIIIGIVVQFFRTRSGTATRTGSGTAQQAPQLP